jgi:hypothetical protein
MTETNFEEKLLEFRAMTYAKKINGIDNLLQARIFRMMSLLDAVKDISIIPLKMPGAQNPNTQ